MFKKGQLSRKDVESLHVTPELISGFYMARPRECCQLFGKPKRMRVNTAAQLLRGKKILFYTGAGISAAARIPDVRVAKNLTVDFHRPFDDRRLAALVRNPQKFIFSLCVFFISLNKRQPTAAHRALKALALYLNAEILTHNLDDLHEKTGLSPVYVRSPWLKDAFTNGRLKATDIVCAIGLKKDTIGLLHRFKQNNAQGIIIAVNRIQPGYLDRNDIFLQGDIQDIIEDLARIMLKGNLCLE
ncbi:MAG: Sir2 family NAD-dependent protein deacetylase [Candidatus Omnitrophota bacterium]